MPVVTGIEGRGPAGRISSSSSGGEPTCVFSFTMAPQRSRFALDRVPAERVYGPRCWHACAVLSLVLLTALAQPLPSALHRGAQEASALLELELPLITTERVEARWKRALGQPRVKALLASRVPMETPATVELRPFAVLRSCLRRTDHRLSVKLLVFLAGQPPQPQVLPLATMGLGLESTPGYENLKAALVESFAWREERMRAVGAEQLWAPQRKALGSENPYLRHLAAEFLAQHEAAAVVDATWGPPGSDERKKNEAMAEVLPDCRG